MEYLKLFKMYKDYVLKDNKIKPIELFTDYGHCYLYKGFNKNITSFKYHE